MIRRQGDFHKEGRCQLVLKCGCETGRGWVVGELSRGQRGPFGWELGRRVTLSITLCHSLSTFSAVKKVSFLLFYKEKIRKRSSLLVTTL
jgi:hypothetical protein